MWRAILGAFTVLVLAACSLGGGIVVNVNFEHLSGLEKDDRVLFDDNVAGHVQSVQYHSDGTYTVQVFIDKGFVSAATEYAQFQVVDDPDRQGRKGVQIRLTRQGGTPLADGATVAGVPAEEDLASKIRKELDAGMAFIMEKMEQFERDIKSFPESQEYQDLKKALEDLATELGQKEKSARERLKKEWLPELQRKLDELRERLREEGHEEQMAPLDQEMDHIRKI
ncbi:MAG: hypothetical protein P8X96_14605 [Desulfobacteraceae bacterium]|jgi:hypothetical protein